MNELKPCPFCGGEAKVFHYSSAIRDEVWHAVCDKPFCAQGPDGYTEAEAIAAWNTRYDPHIDAIPATEENMARYGWVRERTCRDVKPSLPYFKCDSCGMEDMGGTELWIQDGFYRSQKPNYCPNCGARVTPKNSETTPKVVSE